MISTSGSLATSPLPLVTLLMAGKFIAPTESMPAAVQWFAAHQPFTPFIDTVRGLLAGTPVGSSAIATAIWCAVIALGSYLWARASYERRSLR